MVALSRLLDQVNRSVNASLVPWLLAGRCGRDALNSSALRHVAVYPRLGIAYNRIKKNANSTTVVLLRELECGRVEHEQLAKRNSLHLGKLPRPGLVRGLRFMVIVRNPFTRVLSAFLNKFAKPQYVERFRPFDLAPAGFASFVDWLADGGLEADPHWDLQTKLMLMPLDRYDDVIRFERYREELSGWLAARGIDVDREPRASSFRACRAATSRADSRLHDFYTPAVRQRVVRLYHSDFAALGYAEELTGERACGTVRP